MDNVQQVCFCVGTTVNVIKERATEKKEDICLERSQVTGHRSQVTGYRLTEQVAYQHSNIKLDRNIWEEYALQPNLGDDVSI
jgi:hypothetical protein